MNYGMMGRMVLHQQLKGKALIRRHRYNLTFSYDINDEGELDPDIYEVQCLFCESGLDNNCLLDGEFLDEVDIYPLEFDEDFYQR
jgi:hypothetical protein